MSKKNTRDITKSWVVVESEEDIEKPSGVEEVPENPDSDSDSISVISESGASYKTDEEVANKTEIESLINEKTEKLIDTIKQHEILVKPPENETNDMLLYFATSAICALILIGFSVVVQQSFQSSSNVENYEADDSILKINNAKFIRNDDIKSKRIYKNDDAIKVKGNPTANYKPSKNKIANVKCNDKESCATNSENCHSRIQELEVKEEYLREKEKFLIEKEHRLLKRELEINENEPKYQKKYKDKVEKKKRDGSDKKRDVSGQWYTSLHEGRDSMRQKKRSSYKRIKAHWYFQWMVDRARLRVK